ncbi:MAG: FAS1-like dehydratase domain-containing protein [Steroidobacteraceae bacterium]
MAASGIDAADLRTAIGRCEQRRQTFDVDTAARLAALLDWAAPPLATEDLPPLWHWIYFTPGTRAGELGVDGHTLKGGFLPEVPLPRRMFAGARIRFHGPIRIGDHVERCATVRDVQVKEGRSGPLVFVTVCHELSVGGQMALQEEQDIVFRGAASGDSFGGSVGEAPDDAQFSRDVAPDPVLLFRYSALTFNGHRIHYDRDYAMSQEGYPGLVVQAPLIATLLAELLRRHHPDVHMVSARFRALLPIYDTSPFSICGRCIGDAAVLWAQAPGGGIALRLDAQLRETADA